jgi:hypothetical protein
VDRHDAADGVAVVQHRHQLDPGVIKGSLARMDGRVPLVEKSS